MRLDYFRFRFKRDFAFWEITKDVTLYSKPVELYDFRTNELKRFKNLDAVLDVEIDGKKVRDYIEEMDDFPSIVYNGGRGSSSGGDKETFKFGHADLRGQGNNREPLPAALANTKIKSKTPEGALAEFKKNHLLANREFAYEVDDNGYVHQYIKGAAHSVAIGSSNRLPRGTKTMIIHNHPSGGNFSDGDLLSTSYDKRSKGIIASGKNYDYTFTKGTHFKANAFSQAVKTAKMKGSNYDDAVDNWLKKNQKKYGYSYSRKKN